MASAEGYPAGPPLDEGGAKHFKSQLRAQRFDPDRRWGCLHGHTGTLRGHDWSRSSWCRKDADEVGEMEVQRPEVDDGMAVSEMDRGVPGRPELETYTPVKDGLAEEFCEELSKRCVGSSVGRHPENPDFAIRVYELPVVGVEHEDRRVDSDDVSAQLWAPPKCPRPGVEPVPFARLPQGPPEHILEKTLMRGARLSWRGCAELKAGKSRRMMRGAIRPRNAAMRYPKERQTHGMYFDCWIQDAAESFLEVDLGAMCDVTHVSTAGRFPPTELYPTSDMLHEWRKEGVQATSAKRWTIVAPEAVGWEQWVTRYELQARLDGGKSWEPIETLKGNTDMLTEVAHDLREVCRNPKGLQCRYLRFVPVGCHGKPAMRIGVYGMSSAGEVRKQRDIQQERIRYIIPMPLSNRNWRRRERDFISRRAYSPEWYGKYGADFKAKTRRRRLADRTRTEVRELGAGGPPSGSVSGSESRSASADAGAGAGAGADSEAAGTPRGGAAGLSSAAAGEAGAGPIPQPAGAAQPSRPALLRHASSRVLEAMHEQPPPLVRTRTDDERGYCSEPEEVVVDSGGWTLL